MKRILRPFKSNLAMTRWIVLTIGLLLTILFTMREYFVVKREMNLAFTSKVEAIQSQIENKLEFYESVLYQTRAYLLNNPNVTQKQFAEYVRNVSLIDRFPGIQGLSLTLKVKESELKKFKVWPTHERNDYFSIVYLEPNDWRNQRAIGYDMFSEPNRREAMERAWFTGKPSVTRRLTLVQETDKNKQPGLLMFLPLYRPGVPSNTIDEKKNALYGFVGSPFRTYDLFGSVFKENNDDIDVEIYDGYKFDLDNLLYDYNHRPHFLVRNFAPQFKMIKQVNVGGEVFILHTHSLPNFENLQRQSYVWVAFGGILITLLLFWIFHRSYLQNMESHRLHEKYLNENRRLNSVLKQMPEGVIISDPRGKIVLHNDQLDLILGSDPQAFTTQGKKIVSDEWPLARSLEKGEIIKNEELRIVHDDGRVSVINVSSSPIKNGERIVAGVAVLNDITEQKLIQSELEEAIVMRDEFLSVASHELKTPMTSLKLQTQMLRRKMDKEQNIANLKEKIYDVMAVIDKQVNGLNRLVEDMLDISRLKTGKLNIEVSEFSMEDLIKETLDSLRPQFSIAGYQDPLFTHEGPMSGTWDRMRMGQVLINLLTNSMKYGNQKTIEIHAKGTEERIRVCVSDKGIGISEEDQARVFDRFERAIPASEVSGLGLGLFIAKQIVRAHGGNIWVESELNKGSTFMFEVPRRITRLH